MENISFILNKLEDAIIVLDSDQKIVFQNSHSIDLFENNYTGQNITNLIRSPIVLETLENVYKNKRTPVFLISRTFVKEEGTQPHLYSY